VEVWPNQGIGLNGILEGKELAVGNREGEKREQLAMHQCKHLHQCVIELGGEVCGELLKTLDRETCLGRALHKCVCIYVHIYTYFFIYVYIKECIYVYV